MLADAGAATGSEHGFGDFGSDDSSDSGVQEAAMPPQQQLDRFARQLQQQPPSPQQRAPAPAPAPARSVGGQTMRARLAKAAAKLKEQGGGKEQQRSGRLTEALQHSMAWHGMAWHGMA